MRKSLFFPILIPAALGKWYCHIHHRSSVRQGYKQGLDTVLWKWYCHIHHRQKVLGCVEGQQFSVTRCLAVLMDMADLSDGVKDALNRDISWLRNKTLWFVAY